MTKILNLRTARDLPRWAISLGTTLYNKTGTWRNFRPVYENKIPPCNHACPANEKIQGYLDLIIQSAAGRTSASLQKKYTQAWFLLTEDNPFLAVCGRVCFHPCETACNRGFYDESLAIHNIERFIGDYGLSKKLKLKTKKLKKRKKIAIIGGGPAGLSAAYFLAQNGYRPTIFEADKQLGGLLASGIPAYRLPKNILQQEINAIIRLGVEVKTNVRIGRDKLLENILNNHDAVFIATGAHQERTLNITGEDAIGVIPALKFLSDLNTGRKIKLGQKVAVIGGGNAAMDAARSILRLGKEPIVIYRRTKNEMPAILDEINDAEEEKIKFIFLAAPVKIITMNNKIVALECVKMKLGKPDASGRRTPLPVKDSNFKIKVDNVIPAIGEQPDFSFLTAGIKTTDRGIQTDEFGITNIPGIFAAGDCVTGPRTVVEAIGAGKKAADALIKYLQKGKAVPEAEQDEKVVQFEQLNQNYFEPTPRLWPEKLNIQKRNKGFKEVYQPYSGKEVETESKRCFSCGVCNRCDNCFVFCPDMAVLKKNSYYEYNYDYCKGCGICVLECPRYAISLIEEKR